MDQQLMGTVIMVAIILVLFLTVVTVLGFICAFLICKFMTVLEERVEMELAAYEARAVQAAAILPEQAARAPVQLPYFPYAAQGRASVTLCAICLEPLRQGQLCSEVPACRHIFHEACIRVWARRTNNCPLCRVRILPGTTGGLAAADDMV